MMELYPGLKVGKLTLIEQVGAKWRCECDCGNESTPFASNIRRGLSKSCGNCRKNEYEDLGNGVTRVTVSEEYSFIIDTEDVPKINHCKWYISKDNHGFIYINNQNREHLHQVIMGKQEGMEIDHINRDRLDNRKCNLRFCTHQQNQMNQGAQSNSKTGIPGVTFHTKRKQYRARIKMNGVEHHLGWFASLEEAAKARSDTEQRMFGAFGNA